MSYLLKMAFRNIQRNRRRSILAITSVMLAVAFIICMQSFINGYMSSLVKNYTKNECGHIRITTKKYEEEYRFSPVTKNIDHPQAIIDRIKNDPAIASRVRMIAERIAFGVLLSNEGYNKTALAIAGDPVVEKNLLLLNKAILPGGRYLQNERETIIGARIAKALDYTVGDTMKVMAQGSDYALHMRKFAIVGIFKTGLKSLDDAVFQITLSDAKKLLRTGNTTQQLLLMIDDYMDADEVAAAIRDKIGDDALAVTPWTEIGDYGNLVKLASSLYSIIYFAVALLGAFIIGNIMMMIVLERRREIGILKSMGLSRWETLALFIMEGMSLGSIGSLAGTILGIGVSIYFHFNGIDFTKMMGALNFPMDNVIYFSIDFGKLVQAIAIGVLASVVVSIVPSRKAATMNAVDAIKSV
ncbi:MAG: ABC transporter permease [Chitinispirillaceae bacterium]|nr:ABC transporter permease [Chitinispirillaceae bacterium]